MGGCRDPMQLVDQRGRDRQAVSLICVASSAVRDVDGVPEPPAPVHGEVRAQPGQVGQRGPRPPRQRHPILLDRAKDARKLRIQKMKNG